MHTVFFKKSLTPSLISRTLRHHSTRGAPRAWYSDGSGNTRNQKKRGMDFKSLVKLMLAKCYWRNPFTRLSGIHPITTLTQTYPAKSSPALSFLLLLCEKGKCYLINTYESFEWLAYCPDRHQQLAAAALLLVGWTNFTQTHT